jgi:hypothetical protein
VSLNRFPVGVSVRRPGIVHGSFGTERPAVKPSDREDGPTGASVWRAEDALGVGLPQMSEGRTAVGVQERVMVLGIWRKSWT